MASAYIGKQQELQLGKYTAHVRRRIGLIFTGMFVSGWAVTIVPQATTVGHINGQARAY